MICFKNTKDLKIIFQAFCITSPTQPEKWDLPDRLFTGEWRSMGFDVCNFLVRLFIDENQTSVYQQKRHLLSKQMPFTIYLKREIIS